MSSVTILSSLEEDVEEISLDVVKKVDNSLNPRDYQQDAIDLALKDLKSVDRVILELATGLGKSIIFSSLIKNWEGRVLVLVHLRELLTNAYETIESMTGEILGIEMADEHYGGERVCVAMIQSISRKLCNFNPNTFSLIIVDEAHHASTKMYIDTLNYFNCKVVGLTATAKRADGQPLPFDKFSYRMGIHKGIEDGWLVPLEGETVEIESIDLRKVKKTGNGFFDDDSLDIEMVKGASAIADVISEYWRLYKGILFFPGRQSARLVCDMLNEREKGICCYIDGETDSFERKNIVKGLREGKYNWLANVGIAIEGFNWPEATVVGMCSPTNSRTAYIQKVGRVIRPLEGSLPSGHQKIGLRKEMIAGSQKPYGIILDFVGSSAGMNLVSHESILKREIGEQDQILENEEQKEKESTNVNTEELKDIKKIQGNLKNVASSFESTTHAIHEKFNPFDENNEGIENKPKLVPINKIQESKISEKQYNLLAKYGIEDWNISKEKARKIIGYIAQRKFNLNKTDEIIIRKIKDAK